MKIANALGATLNAVVDQGDWVQALPDEITATLKAPGGWVQWASVSGLATKGDLIGAGLAIGTQGRDPWCATLGFRKEPASWGLTTFEVRHLTPESTMTPEFLATFPLAPLQERITAQLDERLARWEQFEPHLDALLNPWRTPFDGTARPASAWAALAYLYSVITESGTSKPAKHLAERIGVAPSVVREWLSAARKRGYLADARRGSPFAKTGTGPAQLATEQSLTTLKNVCN